MTEKDVTKMEEEVGQGGIDPDFQKEWIEGQLAGLALEEKRTVLLWKFYKLMRNDEKMLTVFEDLKKTRQAISVLKEQFV